MKTKIQETMLLIETISAKLGFPINREDYEIQDLGCPHKISQLPEGKCAVYMFFYQGMALKIGKANIKTKARFTYQHYGFNANSTLAKSIVADERFVQMGITRDNVGDWLKAHTHRINILINEKCGAAATELIESVFHYQLRPCFEGALKSGEKF